MSGISRRDMGRALAAALGEGAVEAGPPGRKLKVVVAGGHPGDPEYGCGGTVARYTDLGHHATLLYLNEGEPPDPARKPTGFRVVEARHACEILKARPLFAGQIDGRSVVDLPHYEAFTKILADERPDVIFTQWPVDNHRDHRAIADLTYEAWRRLGSKSALYYYEVSNGEDTLMFSPTEYVDITAVEGRKRAACYAHASQTPDRFYSLQDAVARFRGIESGHGRAEAFVRHVNSPGNLLP